MESSLHEHFGEVVEDNEMTATPRKSPSHMTAPLDLSFKNYISTKGEKILSKSFQHKIMKYIC